MKHDFRDAGATARVSPGKYGREIGRSFTVIFPQRNRFEISRWFAKIAQSIVGKNSGSANRSGPPRLILHGENRWSRPWYTGSMAARSEIPCSTQCSRWARGSRWARAIACLAMAYLFFAASLSVRAGDDLIARRAQLAAGYTERIAELAKWCKSVQLQSQAEFTQAWLPKHEPNTICVFTLPDSAVAPKSLAEGSSAAEWWKKFVSLRNEEAAELMKLADAAVTNKQPALAFELVREAVRENPDLERGRNILGDQRQADRWVSAESARRIRAGQVWSDKFGWLTADQLERYERGMRLYRGRWIDATEDARLHSNIRNGWRIETDHYAVITNHSLEEGVRMASRLEKLFTAWQQAFLTYYAPAAEVERWFARSAAEPSDTPASKAGPSGAAPRKLFEVVYFRNRQEYIDFLKQAEPQIAMSLGYYSDRAKTAYFFAGDEQYDGTVYHEATHQLFREMRSGAVDPGRKSNFWIVEGVACYMESLAEHRLLPDESYGSYITLGGDNQGRLPAARKRLIEDNFYVPLRDLVAFGMNALQHEPRLPMIYSQSTGLTLFFMHAEGARYRPALMDYLVAVYSGRVSLDTLEKLAGQRYEELDRQYREFMK